MARRAPQRPPGRPGRLSGDGFPLLEGTAPDTLSGILDADERPDAMGAALEPLVREWLSDLEIQGRSEQTIGWYRQKMNGYRQAGGAQTLDKLDRRRTEALPR